MISSTEYVERRVLKKVNRRLTRGEDREGKKQIRKIFLT